MLDVDRIQGLGLGGVEGSLFESYVLKGCKP